jgi:hypothetical protein
MTTPAESSGPTEPTGSTGPAQPTHPTQSLPAPPTPPTTPAPAGYPDPAFAPIPRAPRVPWTNPARRGPVIIVSLVAAVVLLGAGLLGGWALSSGHGHDHGFRGYDRMGHANYGPGPAGPNARFGPNAPRGPGTGPQHGGAAAPTPSSLPSAGATG